MSNGYNILGDGVRTTADDFTHLVFVSGIKKENTAILMLAWVILFIHVYRLKHPSCGQKQSRAG